MESTVCDGGHLSLLFHPFLEEQEDRFEVMNGVLEDLSALERRHLLVRAVPGRSLVGAGTPRGVRRWAPAHPTEAWGPDLGWA
jgi:hypothetical protein